MVAAVMTKRPSRLSLFQDAFPNLTTLRARATIRHMAEIDSLEALQGLQRDLLALTASQLPTVERLWAELESQIDEFRKLLDKPRKNDASRRTLTSGSDPFSRCAKVSR